MVNGKVKLSFVIQVKSQDKLKLTSCNFSNKNGAPTGEISKIVIVTLKSVIPDSTPNARNC